MQTDNTDLGGSVCSVTPSDQAGQIDNILSRLDAIEQAIRELQSQNISATQLSDIAASAGWIYDVTYMGTPGWTQTPAGTLIPPVGTSLSTLGLLMSDGNPYQFVSVDSDGVLQFGTAPSGGSSGGGGGASLSGGAYLYNDSSIPNTSGGTTEDPYENVSNPDVTVNASSLTINKAGLYYVGWDFLSYRPFSTSAVGVQAWLEINGFTSDTSHMCSAQFYTGGSSGFPEKRHAGGLFRFDLNDEIVVKFQRNNGTVQVVGVGTLSLMWISSQNWA